MEGALFVCTKDRQVSNGNLQDTKLHGRNFVSTFPLRENGCTAPPIPARRMGKDAIFKANCTNLWIDCRVKHGNDMLFAKVYFLPIYQTTNNHE